MDGGTGDPQTLVVVGNGMTSHRLCRALAECGATTGPLRLVVFGEEPRPAYDRIRLTELLGGRTEEELWLAPPSWYQENDITLRLGDPIVAIDRDECVVRSSTGVVVPYDRLVLATGSIPFVPPVPGTDLPGVFVYRTVEDLYAILDHARDAALAAVIGGGLLGIEAARALLDLGLEVHVLEGSRGLLPRQLDEVGARLLGEKVQALGLKLHLGARTTGIARDGARLAVAIEGGARIVADLVVLSAGIRPRAELGLAAGLAMTAGGVAVDDHLTSSDPRIFAVGECAAHRGVTYGLAAPGYRMIDVLVDNLVGGDALFQGADRSARLKLLGVTVAALGRYQEAPTVQTHTYMAGGVYRKLLVCDDRIVGALAVGEWDDLERVREAIANPRRFSFWDLRRFRSTGTLWLASESRPVRDWPPEALVCGCLGVRRGTLAEAEAAGCATVEALSATTGAGTMCGACRPLLAELVLRRELDGPPTLRCGGADGHHDEEAPLSQPRSLRLPPPPSSLLLPPRSIPPHSTPPRSSRSVAPAAYAPGPRSSRPPIFLPAREVTTLNGVLPAVRAELATLPSAELAPITEDHVPQGSTRRVRGPLFADEPHPPPSTSPSSVPPPSAPPSERWYHPPPSGHVEPPSSRPPFSGPRSEPPASSRRDSLAPLRPISVPPSAITGRPSGRLPPSIPASVDARAPRRGALLATASLAAGGAAALALLPAASPAATLRGLHAEVLWTQRTAKVTSGYATVVLSLLGLVLTVRKRSRHLHRLDVGGLQVLHGGLGVAALVALACHTGLRSGERLDLLLSIDFFAVAALGGLAAAAMAMGEPAASQVRRIFASRAHLYVLLPLPVLVALHVLGAYYF